MSDSQDPKRSKSLVSNIQGLFAKAQASGKKVPEPTENQQHQKHPSFISNNVLNSSENPDSDEKPEERRHLKIEFNPLEKERQRLKNNLDYYDKNKQLMELFDSRFSEMQKKNTNHVSFSREQIEQIISDLKYLRSCEERHLEKQEETTRIRQEYNEIKNNLMNQDSMLKNIEMSYLDKINELVAEFRNKEKVLEEKMQIQLAIESRQKAELKESANLLIKQRENCEGLAQKCEILESELERMRVEFSTLKREYDLLNDVRRTKLPSIMDFSKKKMDIDLRVLLSSSLRTTIFEFLQPTDLLNLRALSKFYFQALTFDISYFSLVTKNVKLRFDKELNRCVAQLSMQFFLKILIVILNYFFPSNHRLL